MISTQSKIFQIIESSSAGNCAFLEWEGVRILIDAGVGMRRVCSYLKERGLDLDDINAVFITHEHSDHCKALKSFAKRGITVFANKLTAESIVHIMPETRALNWRIFEDGMPFDFLGIKVQAFSIPHDTSDAVGYCFGCGDKNVVWMTDLGKITMSVRDIAMRANILVLESNYCPVMLENSSRPFSLKSRIKGSHGHLSNSDAMALLSALEAERLERVFLAHVSKECNAVERIKEVIAACDAVGGLCERIEIVSPFSLPSSVFEF